MGLQNQNDNNDPRFTGQRPNFARLRDDLVHQTERITTVRTIRTAVIEDQAAKKVLTMPDNKTSIRGLSEAILAAKKSMAMARAAPALLAEAAAELKKTCDELTAHVTAMHEDIKFDATQLGNGGEASETKSEE